MLPVPSSRHVLSCQVLSNFCTRLSCYLICPFSLLLPLHYFDWFFFSSFYMKNLSEEGLLNCVTSSSPFSAIISPFFCVVFFFFFFNFLLFHCCLYKIRRNLRCMRLTLDSCRNLLFLFTYTCQQDDKNYK